MGIDTENVIVRGDDTACIQGPLRPEQAGMGKGQDRLHSRGA